MSPDTQSLGMLLPYFYVILHIVCVSLGQALNSPYVYDEIVIKVPKKECE